MNGFESGEVKDIQIGMIFYFSFESVDDIRLITFIPSSATAVAT